MNSSSIIGLRIVKADGGAQQVLSVNEEQTWTKFVTNDLRKETNLLSGLNKDNTFIMYSTSDSHEFFTVIRDISEIGDRDGAFIAAWISVPLDMNISGSALVEIINETRNEILSPKINTDRLRDLFSDSYIKNDVPKAYTETKGETVAVRYYGKGYDYSLSELLNMNLSQPYNGKYRRIFLIDGESGIKAKSCDDITDKRLAPSFIITAPEKTNGFIPTIDKKDFTGKVSISKGDVVTIVWKKTGYCDIKKTVTIENDSPDFSFLPTDVKMAVSHSNIHIVDEDGDPLEGYTLIINKQELKQGYMLPVSEDVIGQSEITVRCAGYETYTKTQNLRGSVRITLKKEVNGYVFSLPLLSRRPDYVEITINSKEEIKKSPIAGYVTRGTIYPVSFGKHVNDLYYDPYVEVGKERKKGLILAIIAFVAGLIIGISTVYFFAHKKMDNLQGQIQKAQTEQQAKAEEAKQKEMSKKTSNAAVDYLKGHTKWVKSEMEEYECLKGLWDEINNLEYDKILSRKSELDRAEDFNELCTQIEALRNSGNKLGAPICNPGDETITIKGDKGLIEKMRKRAEAAPSQKTTSPKTTEQPKKEEKSSKDELLG